MPDWTFETPGPLRAVLELTFGEIEVDTVPGDTTHVSLEGDDPVTRDLIDKARVELKERGQGHELVVEVRHRGFMISLGRSPDIRVRITCPPGADLDVQTKSADLRARGSYGSIEAKTASGDMSIGEAAGDVRVKTASGDVSIEDVGGQMQVQSASGDVAVQRTGGPATVQAVSGDVWIRDAALSVHVNTVSGDQRIDAVVEGNVEAHAVSGDIQIGIRRGSAVYVDANTISGSTSSELDLGDAPDANESADDDAPLVEVRAKTVSGDISILRAGGPARLPAG